MYTAAAAANAKAKAKAAPTRARSARMGKSPNSALIETCSSVEVNHNCLTPHSGEMDLNATLTFGIYSGTST